MSQAARITGVNVTIDVSLDSGSTWSQFGAIQNYTIDQSKDEFDATCGLDTNKITLTGKPNFKVSGNYVLEYDNPAILVAFESTSPSLLRLFVDKTNQPAKYWQASFNVSGGVTVSCTDVTKGPINLTATTSVTRTWS